MQRRALLVVAAALAAAVAFGFGAAAFDAVPADQSPPLSGPAAGEPSGGGGGGGTVPDTVSGSGSAGCVLCVPSARSLVAGLLPSVDPLALVAVAVVVVASAVGLGLRASEDAPPVEDPSGDGAGVAAAAERDGTPTAPDDADATNDVYRAWAALTDRVPVSAPATTTPREYAAAAVEAGFDRDPVMRLTEAFESVRYGGDEPTDEREREARTALDEVDADR